MDATTIEDVLDYVGSYYEKKRKPSSKLIRLDDESAYCVLCAAAFLGRFAKMDGFQAQRLFVRMRTSGVRTENELRSWIDETFCRVNTRRWDSSRKRAQEFLEAEIKVFAPSVEFFGPVEDRPSARTDALQCPGVIFGKGCPPEYPPLLAVFNSRKPRRVCPDSSWLDAMRCFLRGMDRGGIGLAGSTGTLTYDLASALALRLNFLQLLIAPFPLFGADRQLFTIFEETAKTLPTISCMVDGAPCRGKLPMRCRDRLLAAMSDFHLVLEIRSGGNLLAVLEQIQSKSPRPHFVLTPDTPRTSSGGNLTLLKKFPEHAVGFKASRPQEPVQAEAAGAANSFSSSKKASRECSLWRGVKLARDTHLFHYTRGCVGPWPGETYRQYLLDLLDAGLLSTGGSALASLARIAREGLLRASCHMIRGKIPVVSWSSVPPHKLFLMRTWRRPFARWNVEPYGVALRRDILRPLGAKPAIYGSEEVYSKLPDSEKYRFQLSRPRPGAAWRQEREWRIANDLLLTEIKPDQGFFFVQTAREAERLYGCTDPGLPVIAMSEQDF
ncbi:MAG: hypothetical protein P4L43_08315 [Syntrophobacteraceae bacterium]|nr:hypothetical protein [Syntrophobacteraceae bacterium]